MGAAWRKGKVKMCTSGEPSAWQTFRPFPWRHCTWGSPTSHHSPLHMLLHSHPSCTHSFASWIFRPHGVMVSMLVSQSSGPEFDPLVGCALHWQKCHFHNCNFHPEIRYWLQSKLWIAFQEQINGRCKELVPLHHNAKTNLQVVLYTLQSCGRKDASQEKQKWECMRG